MQSRDDILIKHGWDGAVPYDENITINYCSLLEAMQEYANKVQLSPNELQEIAQKYATRIVDVENTEIKYSEHFVHGWMVASFLAGYRLNN